MRLGEEEFHIFQLERCSDNERNLLIKHLQKVMLVKKPTIHNGGILFHAICGNFLQGSSERCDISNTPWIEIVHHRDAEFLVHDE